jgi:hypothetical protein
VIICNFRKSEILIAGGGTSIVESKRGGNMKMDIRVNNV